MNHSLPLLAVALAQSSSQAAGGGGRTMLVWAVVAFGLAVLLVVVEAFMPSGGIIGALAGVCAIVGIVLFFRFDTMWGLVSMAVTLVSLPFLIMGMIWLWPNTIVGRWLTHDEAQTPVLAPGVPASEGAVAVGIEGKALTDLRPVGACRLSGQRLDCIAQAGVIEAGTAVRVVAVEGSTIKVRPV